MLGTASVIHKRNKRRRPLCTSAFTASLDFPAGISIGTLFLGSLCMVRRPIASIIFDGRSGLLLCIRLLGEALDLLRAMMESAPTFS
jgi:hypothetical protein